MVTPEPLAPYSGMVPGWLAGHYTWEECCIDFALLCKRAKARLVIDRAAGLDTARRQLMLAGTGSIEGDILVLNIGSTVRAPTHSAVRMLPTRPLSALRGAVEGLAGDLRALGRAPELVGIGGGAAGIEVLLGLRRRLQRTGLRPTCTLLGRDDALVRGLPPGAADLARRSLVRAGVTLRGGFEAIGFDNGHVLAANGATQKADAVLWAAGAAPHAWPAESGLAVDAAGFVTIDATLRSISHPWVFAVGDCASFNPRALPKAGVFSVRMGPVLADNVRATLRNRTLRPYVPQSRQLVLINTADGAAIASRGGYVWRGRLAMAWKDWIDRRFLARYR